MTSSDGERTAQAEVLGAVMRLFPMKGNVRLPRTTLPDGTGFGRLTEMLVSHSGRSIPSQRVETAIRVACELWSQQESDVEVGSTESLRARNFERRSLDMMPHPSLFLSLCLLSSAGLSFHFFDREGRRTLRAVGVKHPHGSYAALLAAVIGSHGSWWSSSQRGTVNGRSVLRHLVEDRNVRRFLRVNLHAGIVWFNRERYGDLVFWLYMLALLEIRVSSSRESMDEEALFGVISVWTEARLRSRYQLELLLDEVEKSAAA